MTWFAFLLFKLMPDYFFLSPQTVLIAYFTASSLRTINTCIHMRIISFLPIKDTRLHIGRFIAE